MNYIWSNVIIFYISDKKAKSFLASWILSKLH